MDYSNVERQYIVFWLDGGQETARCDARNAEEAVQLVSERFGLCADELAALPISRYE